MNPGLIWKHTGAPPLPLSDLFSYLCPKRTLQAPAYPKGILLPINTHTHTNTHTPRETSGPQAEPGLRPRLHSKSTLKPQSMGVEGGTEPPACWQASLSEAVGQLVAVQLPLGLQAPWKLHPCLPVHTPALAALPIQGWVTLPRQRHERSAPRKAEKAGESHSDSNPAPTSDTCCFKMASKGKDSF
jgi:hypothetical protein